MPYCELEGIKLHYRRIGTGKPILLIHGLGGDTTSWEFVEPFLSKNFELIIPDLRCHGKSGCPEGIAAPALFAEDIAKLVDSLDIAPIPVVGISLGGMVVQQMILDYPSKFTKAVLIDTTPKVREELIDMVYAWREMQVEEGDEAYWWKATKDTLPKEFIEQNPDLMDYLRSKFLSGQTEANVLSSIGFASFDVVSRLNSIRIPVLVIHGADDRLIVPENGQLLHQLIPDSQLEIVDACGHSPDIQFPEELSMTISSFLRIESV